MGRALKARAVSKGGKRGSRESRFEHERQRKYQSPIDKAKGYEVIWPNVSPLFEATRKMSDPCYVYAIGEEDGPLKIGKAKDPISRLRTMQTGNPRRLCIEWVLVGDLKLERWLLRTWRNYAVVSPSRTRVDLNAGTEWFNDSARLDLDAVWGVAVHAQLEYLAEGGRNPSFERLALLVRQAHVAGEFDKATWEEVRTLGPI